MDIRLIPAQHYKLAVTPQHQASEEEKPTAHSPENIKEAFVHFVNTMEHMVIIAHLLPTHARKLPLLAALTFLNHAAVTSHYIVNMLLAGWQTWDGALNQQEQLWPERPNAQRDTAIQPPHLTRPVQY